MLDFAVIGFQKCGTCSVRKWLRDHPEVAVPEGELSPYLVSEPFGPRRTTVGEFMDVIASQPKARVIGTVDPTYALCDVTANARNMAECSPETKIITIERDPVERAYSAWNMARLAGGDNRSFEEAIRSCLESGPSWTETNWLRQSYVEAGEYDRICLEFARHGFEMLRLRLATGSKQIASSLAYFLGIAPSLNELPHEHKTEYFDQSELTEEVVNLLEYHYSGARTS